MQATQLNIYIETGNFLKPISGIYDYIYAIIPDYNLYLYHTNKNKGKQTDSPIILLDTGNTLETVIQEVQYEMITVCLGNVQTYAKNLAFIQSLNHRRETKIRVTCP